MASSSGLQQQANVDWTRLAASTANFSGEVLNRLSSAGVEAPTLAIAQRLFGRIFPIGAHGEYRLNEALAALKEFGTIGRVIWFGIGVRHVLCQIVTTSGGASCVALIACLSESHSPAYCARVLYEMARQSKVADGITPSLQQWEYLVQVCCGVFAQTTFGLQVSQLLKLAGHLPSALSTARYARSGDPANLAEILRLPGQVSSGQERSLTIVGGPECCWLFILCDFLLGFTVCLRDKDSSVLIQKQSSDVIQVQLQIRHHDSLTASPSANNLVCILKSSYTSSADLIERLFRPSAEAGLTLNASAFPDFIGGRIQWKDVISHLCGTRAELLTRIGTDACNLFLVMLVAGSNVIVSSFGSCRYSSIEEYIQICLQTLPELRELRSYIECLLLQSKFDNTELAAQTFEEAKRELDRILTPENNLKTSSMCETIIGLPYLIDEIIFDSPLLPTLGGLQWLLKCTEERPDVRGAYQSTSPADILRQRLVFNYLPTRSVSRTLMGRFDAILRIFSGNSGELPQLELWTEKTCSAMCYNGIYCYSDLLVNLSDQYKKNTRIHLGVGNIYARDKSYSLIYDIDHQLSPNPKPLGVPTRPLTKGELDVYQIVDTGDWKVDMVVEESAELRCSIAMRAGKQEALLSPAFFVNVILPAAVWWRTLPPRNFMTYENKLVDRILPYDTASIPQRHCHSSELARCVVTWGNLGRCNLINDIDELPHFIASLFTNLASHKISASFEELNDNAKTDQLSQWFTDWLQTDPGFSNPEFWEFSQSSFKLVNRIFL